MPARCKIISVDRSTADDVKLVVDAASAANARARAELKAIAVTEARRI